MTSGRSPYPTNRSRRVRASCVGAPSVGVVAILSIGLASCTSSSEHTIEPYRSSPVQALVLEMRASARCLLSGENDHIQPIRSFTTDGCSSFPDTEWNLSCCVEHDIAYWCGGDAEARAAADAEFGRCVAENKNALVGWTMRTGVRMGGHPIFPTSYRWGYGHPYRWSYPSAVAGE